MIPSARDAVDQTTLDELARLITIMRQLRDPQDGCPWDVQQTFESIAPYTIEEAYEVADAIANGDMNDIRDELGDLLLQVVFHARMAEEDGSFALADVAKSISDKMVERHPHVFGTDDVVPVDDQNRRWEEQKAAERARRRPAGHVGHVDEEHGKDLLVAKRRELGAWPASPPRRSARCCPRPARRWTLPRQQHRPAAE